MATRKEQSKEVRDAYKKGKTAYNMAYTKANCDRIELRLHKGTKAEWSEAAEDFGYDSLTAFIADSVKKAMSVYDVVDSNTGEVLHNNLTKLDAQAIVSLYAEDGRETFCQKMGV